MAQHRPQQRRLGAAVPEVIPPGQYLPAVVLPAGLAAFEGWTAAQVSRWLTEFSADFKQRRLGVGLGLWVLRDRSPEADYTAEIVRLATLFDVSPRTLLRWRDQAQARFKLPDPENKADLKDSDTLSEVGTGEDTPAETESDAEDTIDEVPDQAPHGDESVGAATETAQELGDSGGAGLSGEPGPSTSGPISGGSTVASPTEETSEDEPAGDSEPSKITGVTAEKQRTTGPRTHKEWMLDVALTAVEELRAAGPGMILPAATERMAAADRRALITEDEKAEWVRLQREAAERTAMTTEGTRPDYPGRPATGAEGRALLAMVEKIGEKVWADLASAHDLRAASTVLMEAADRLDPKSVPVKQGVKRPPLAVGRGEVPTNFKKGK